MGFSHLAGFVTGMLPELSETFEEWQWAVFGSLRRPSWGWKLCGAGGGGYGIAFIQKPEDRQSVVDDFREHGLWATIPELRQGVKYD